MRHPRARRSGSIFLCRAVNAHVLMSLEAAGPAAKYPPYLPRASAPQMRASLDDRVVSGISSFAFQVGSLPATSHSHPPSHGHVGRPPICGDRY